jgi:hypothetical protein
MSGKLKKQLPGMDDITTPNTKPQLVNERVQRTPLKVKAEPLAKFSIYLQPEDKARLERAKFDGKQDGMKADAVWSRAAELLERHGLKD